MTKMTHKINNSKSLINIIQSLATPIFVKDIAHKWVLVNQAFCELLGRAEDEIIGKSDYDFFPKDQADIFWEMDDQVFQGREVNVNEEKITISEGNTRYIETKKMVFQDEEFGDVLCGIITDITEVKQYQSQLDRANHDLIDKVKERTEALQSLNQKLKLMAFKDRLTGLKNRNGFDLIANKRIQQAAINNEKLAFIFLDMDDLKYVNDSYGHPVGDLLIQQAGERLRQIVGDDGTIGRIGGDEFLIMMPYTDAIIVHQMASDISIQMQLPAKVLNKSVPLSSSLGVSCYPEHGSDWVSLFQNADCAMYVAKNNKKGSYEFYQEKFTTKIKRKFDVENELRKALHLRQIKVEFQPILNCQTQELQGYEALARWHSAEFGQIGPDEFIPIAEQSDLIIELGQQVLEQAMDFIACHCKPDEYVSVNVSAIQLKNAEFGALLQHCIITYDISPSQLAIEVTESVLMEVNQSLKQIIRSFNLQGIKIFVDDFGTGYSNLMQLRKLKFNTLKIDSDFTKGLADSAVDRSLLKAISLMAKEMELDVVAEGIETQEQRQCLIDLGIPYAQGYLWSQSKPAQYWKDKKL